MPSKTKTKKNHFPRAFLMAGHKKTPPKVKVSSKSFKPKARPAPHPCESIDCKSGDDTYQDAGGHWWCGFCLLTEHDDAIKAGGVVPIDQRPEVDEEGRFGCGCERAGIGVFNDDHQIQRCDDCNLFETDDDAAEAVDHLIKLLYAEYREYGGTVADAMDRLVDLQDREALKFAEAALALGDKNCGSEADNAFHEPLKRVREMLEKETPPAPRALVAPYALATEFARVVKANFSARDLKVIVQRNASPEYEGCCATHDFCDANILMLEAWEKLMGKGLPRDNKEQAVWNRAWSIARAAEFEGFGD